MTPWVLLDIVDTVFTSDTDVLQSNAPVSTDKPRDTSQEVSPISKFLISPLPAAPSVAEALPRARLVTSAVRSATRSAAQLEENKDHGEKSERNGWEDS